MGDCSPYLDCARHERGFAVSADNRIRVAVLLSGRGSNLKALIDAEQDAYDITLVVSNVEDAGGLAIARAAGIATFALAHKGIARAEFDAIVDAQLRTTGSRRWRSRAICVSCRPNSSSAGPAA